MRTKGNGRGQPLFHVEEFNETLAYLSGKGEGNRRHTSGKGAGRRMDPTGRYGQLMKFRVCNSPEHFEARCPQSRNTSASPQLLTQAVEGPLADILGHTNHGVTSYPIFSINPVPVIEEPPEERTLYFMVRDRIPNQSTSNDPIWQQESDPWQGTTRAVPKPPPQEHSRLAPKAKAAPEQESSPWTNWAAHVQETSAESSDTSRVAQASEQESLVNPQQPPRLRPRLGSTSDLGRPFHEISEDTLALPRNPHAALPTDRSRMPIANTNHGINSIFSNRTEDINDVNTAPCSDSAFMRAARSSSVEAQPIAGNIAAAVQQTTSLVEPPRMTDNIIQQSIAGYNMANEIGAQQRHRNDRAGGTRTPSHTVPTALHRMIALSQGRHLEPPLQAPVHNPDPLGFFPNSSLFAGSIKAPQQAEAPVTSIQQTEFSSCKSIHCRNDASSRCELNTDTPC